MKTKRILKILLLTFSILLVGLLITAMFFIIVIENASIKYRMLIPLFIIASGILGIAYQFKTLKYYRFEVIKKEIKNPLFWISNAAFGIALISITSYLAYILFFDEPFETNSTDFIYVILVFGIPLILGISVLIEEALLYKRLNQSKSEILIDSIEDIKGNKDDDSL